MSRVSISLKSSEKQNPNSRLERRRSRHVSHCSDETYDPNHTTCTNIHYHAKDSTIDCSRQKERNPGVLCYKGDQNGLREQLSAGANPDCLYLNYPLTIIALQKQPILTIINTLQMLRAFNGNITIRDPQLKRTVLLESASKLMTRELDYIEKYPILLQWLVDTNLFNIHERDFDEGCGILHFVVLTKHDKYIPSLLLKCIELGADPRSEDSKGYNALAYVVKFQPLNILMEVMEKVPSMRDAEVLQRAIAKSSWMSKKRSYLKEWLNECNDFYRFHSI
ncbi:10451_t:CDS:2 [Ambispora leptoticha]|uniref:10451_t:CDS:1 n=1 Tax=Ambispora leptoticha TaxID=144679 RepID=A0A9N9GSE9_9GLOM|nr:10451_t:CDS:2 [Ambispora leptoticha]